MKSIILAMNGLVSSLLLNVGLTGLAEKLDPMVQLNGDAVRKMQNAKSSAFSDLPCQFAIRSAITLVRSAKSAAFSDLPCQFKTSAFSDLPCQFKTSAFSDLPCQFKTSAFSDLPCQFSAQSAS